jgi:hypothetical protein
MDSLDKLIEFLKGPMGLLTFVVVTVVVHKYIMPHLPNFGLEGEQLSPSEKMLLSIEKLIIAVTLVVILHTYFMGHAGPQTINGSSNLTESWILLLMFFVFCVASFILYLCCGRLLLFVDKRPSLLLPEPHEETTVDKKQTDSPYQALQENMSIGNLTSPPEENAEDRGVVVNSQSGIGGIKASDVKDDNSYRPDGDDVLDL